MTRTFCAQVDDIIHYAPGFACKLVPIASIFTSRG